MKVLRLLSMATLIIALGIGATSCKKVNDADLQTAAQTALAANPDLAGVLVSVEKQVATLNGTVIDDAAKANAESIVAGVKDIKSVINNLEVLPPAPDYTELDATINAALVDALKDHKTVTATVQDGVITVTGEARQKDVQTIMEKLNALNPVQVVNNLTVK